MKHENVKIKKIKKLINDANKLYLFIFNPFIKTITFHNIK